jgi:hypothetical protein
LEIQLTITLLVVCQYEESAHSQLLGPPLLPIIAEHADLKTMSILASSHPIKLSLNLGVDSIAENQDVLQKRRDYDEKLAKAFAELITIAQAEEIMAESPNSLAESGLLFHSARSSFHSDLADAMASLEEARFSDSEASTDGKSDPWANDREVL